MRLSALPVPLIAPGQCAIQENGESVAYGGEVFPSALGQALVIVDAGVPGSANQLSTTC